MDLKVNSLKSETSCTDLVSHDGYSLRINAFFAWLRRSGYTVNDTSSAESDTNDDSDAPTEEEMQETMQIVAEEESQQVKPSPVKEQPKGNQTYRDYMLYQSERPTAVVALRLGDFYEVFGDNAVTLEYIAERLATTPDDILLRLRRREKFNERELRILIYLMGAKDAFFVIYFPSFRFRKYVYRCVFGKKMRCQKWRRWKKK